MSMQQLALDALNRHGPLTTQQLADVLGVPRTTVESACYRLADKFAISREEGAAGKTWKALGDTPGDRAGYFTNAPQYPAWLAGVGG